MKINSVNYKSREYKRTPFTSKPVAFTGLFPRFRLSAIKDKAYLEYGEPYNHMHRFKDVIKKQKEKFGIIDTQKSQDRIVK